MSLFGLDFFESKEARKIKENEYKKLIFPFGDEQKFKILNILKSLIKKTSDQELLYNYIICKEEIMKKGLNDYKNNEIKELILKMNNLMFSKNYDCIPYIVLADIDIHIDNNLDYPSIDTIINEINSLKY